MRRILEREEYVEVPPAMYDDPFFRMTYLVKEEIRKYKWLEGEKGRQLSWEQARKEWWDAHHQKFEQFLMGTLVLAPASPREEAPPAKPEPGASVGADGFARVPPSVRP
jgi:hypothetical protein